MTADAEGERIARVARRFWALGYDTHAIAWKLFPHFPGLSINQIEPIVHRLLIQAREERRIRRLA